MSAKSGKSVVEIILNSEALDAASDLAEVAIENLVNADGLAKDVPVLREVLAFIRAPVRISEQLFTRRLLRCLRAIRDNTNEDTRRQFYERYQTDGEFVERVKEHLLLTVSRLDDMGKSDLIGGAMAAMMRGDIDYDEFRALAFAIDRCLITDLERLRIGTVRSVLVMDDEVASNGRLTAAGLIFTRSEHLASDYTDLGWTMVRILLTERSQEG